MSDFLDSLIDKYGDTMVNQSTEIAGVVSTGSVSVDISTDIGGIPKGRISHIHGPESSGKTTLAIEICANEILKGGKALYIDLEQTLDRDLVTRIFYKYDLPSESDNFIVAWPEFAEDAFRISEDAIRSGEFEVIVIDSIGAMLPEKEMQDDFGDSNVALTARSLTSFCRRNAHQIRVNGVAFIFLNQVRDAIGNFFKSFELPGGHAIKHYTSMEIALYKSSWIEEPKDHKIGNEVKFTITKNKVGIPFRSARFPIVWGTGIDFERDVLYFANELGVVESRGSYKAFEGKTIGQGIAKSLEELRENKELLDRIIEECYNAVGVEIGFKKGGEDVE